MMCNNCSAEIADGSTQCWHCGSQTQYYPPPPPPPKPSSGNDAMIAVMVLVVVAILLLSIFSFSAIQDSSSNDNNVVTPPPSPSPSQSELCRVTLSIVYESTQTVLYNNVHNELFSDPSSIRISNDGFDHTEVSYGDDSVDVIFVTYGEGNSISFEGTFYINFDAGGGLNYLSKTYRISCQVQGSDGRTIDSYSGTYTARY